MYGAKYGGKNHKHAKKMKKHSNNLEGWYKSPTKMFAFLVVMIMDWSYLIMIYDNYHLQKLKAAGNPFYFKGQGVSKVETGV